MPDITDTPEPPEYTLCPACGESWTVEAWEEGIACHPRDGRWSEEHCASCCVRCDSYRCEVHDSRDGSALVWVEECGEERCEDHMNYCSSCDEATVNGSLCFSCEEAEANDDEDTEGPHGFINGYSYRPVPDFHGTGPMYLGIEHEMEFTSQRGRDTVVELAAHIAPSLLYMKSDSSLIANGCEFVSHPMGFDYAIDSYPYAVVEAMAENGGIPDDNAGVHIHMSRDGFLSKYHLWKFIHFHLANPAFVKALAGRDSPQWAKFDTAPASRKMTKGGAVDLTIEGTPVYDFVRKFGQGGHPYDRYYAVNLRNTATVELRYFASTVNPDVIKGYFDYLKALYHFTNEAKVRNRAHPERSLSGLAFRQWALSGDDYPHFARLLAGRSIPMSSLGRVETAPFAGKEQ